MHVSTYIPQTYEKAFERFDFKPFGSSVRIVKLLAYEGIVDDELMFAYEVYGTEESAPCFYGTSHYDHSDGNIERPEEVMRNWTRSTHVKLIETDGLNFLFELTEPFGIIFSQD